MFNTDPFKNYPQPPKPIEWKSPPAPHQPKDADELRSLRNSIANYIIFCRNLGYYEVANDLQMILDK